MSGSPSVGGGQMGSDALGEDTEDDGLVEDEMGGVVPLGFEVFRLADQQCASPGERLVCAAVRSSRSRTLASAGRAAAVSAATARGRSRRLACARARSGITELAGQGSKFDHARLIARAGSERARRAPGYAGRKPSAFIPFRGRSGPLSRVTSISCAFQRAPA